jgi:predicted RNA binding protein YcfA (HicA-like mRNA interferase family)
MHKGPVKTKDLLRIMHRLDFVETKHGPGNHMRMQHPRTGLMLFIPLSRKEVPPVMLRGIQKQLENFNIISEEKFEEMLTS